MCGIIWVFHLFQVRRALPRHGGLNRVTMSQLVICFPRPWFRWIWEWCSWPLCKWSGAPETCWNPGNPGSFLGQKNSGCVKGLTHDLPSNPPSMILNTPSFWRSIIRAHLRSWMNLLGAHKISLSISLFIWFRNGGNLPGGNGRNGKVESGQKVKVEPHFGWDFSVTCCELQVKKPQVPMEPRNPEAATLYLGVCRS